MTAALGFGSESVFAHAIERFQKFGLVEVIDLESIIYSDNFRVEIEGGALELNGDRNYRISPAQPLYHRVFIRPEEVTEAGLRLKQVFDALVAFSLERAPGSVLINNPLASAINASKSAQLDRLAGLGFETPETILSTSAKRLRDFHARHLHPVNKGASGTRTMAARLADWETEFGSSAWPVLLQEYIPGFDVRLHCVGLETIALKIETAFLDYRYAERNGYSVQVSPVAIPPEIRERCWTYMKEELQEFSAFDFRVNDGCWVLLEVNPMPGYAFFDRYVDGAISEALWRLLCQGYSNLVGSVEREGFLPPSRRPRVDMGMSRMQAGTS